MMGSLRHRLRLAIERDAVRRTVFAIVILLPLATGSWAQQQNAAADQNSQQSSTVVRSAHSTKADLEVPLCPSKFDDSLATNGIAGRQDKNVKPPSPINQVEAEFPETAKRELKREHLRSFDGVVVISLVADEHGVPQNPCLLKSLGFGFDTNAANAVQQFRFAPATLNGAPVPMRFVVEVNFLY